MLDIVAKLVCKVQRDQMTGRHIGCVPMVVPWSIASRAYKEVEKLV